MINAGLSLDLSNFFPKSNNRLDYAEKITGNVNTPSKKKDDSENPPIATSTPNTLPADLFGGSACFMK